MRLNCNGIWNNTFSTNCYAYALGLDIPEKEIIFKAYIPGTIGSIKYRIPSKKLNNLTLEVRISLDLKALNISYDECTQSEISFYDFNTDYYQWVIALFISSDGDFHFMRKAWDNIWWHKKGYNFENPINYDEQFETIYNPEECKIDYQYVKCLKLSSKI